eukprot:GHVT01072356.1.p4 GENE.GHVT01072356.1~~GHVT01072356.1.p4  ORF type:complete len:110 (-),score=32.02 GHVT01072356.1:1551-1880(-)
MGEKTPSPAEEEEDIRGEVEAAGAALPDALRVSGAVAADESNWRGKSSRGAGTDVEAIREEGPAGGEAREEQAAGDELPERRQCTLRRKLGMSAKWRSFYQQGVPPLFI